MFMVFSVQGSTCVVSVVKAAQVHSVNCCLTVEIYPAISSNEISDLCVHNMDARIDNYGTKEICHDDSFTLVH